MRDYLERIKVYCPSCPLPHNLSGKDVDRILNEFEKETNETINMIYASNKKHKPIVDVTKNIIKSHVKKNIINK